MVCAMTALETLQRARRDGVTLSVGPRGLRAEPRRRVTPALGRAIRKHEAEISELLRHPPLDAAVVIAAHGVRFVIIPDTEEPGAWVSHGVPLRLSEIRHLAEGRTGSDLPASAVRALALVKCHLEGEVVGHSQSVDGGEL